MKLGWMLSCECGVTFGTRKALERHLQKFAGTAEAEYHTRSLGALRERVQPQPAPVIEPVIEPAARTREGPEPLLLPCPPSPTSSLQAAPERPKSSGVLAEALVEPVSPVTPKRPPQPLAPSLRHFLQVRGSPPSPTGALPPMTLQELAQVDCGGVARRDTECFFGPGRFRVVAETVRKGVITPGPTGLEIQVPIRLLLVRHAQSANKALAPGHRASANPGLTELGEEQAAALGARLAREFGPRGPRRSSSLLIVSSPMRRCLLTILPTMQQLKLNRDSCLCHGGCYEFGCAGKGYRGSTSEDIAYEFPEFTPVAFSDDGKWDYRGNCEKESEAECRARAARIVDWLRVEGASMLQARSSGGASGDTIILCMHQTIADLLCHLLLDGSCAGWAYGELKHSLRNSSFSELFLHANGRATYGVRDDDAHAACLRAWSSGKK